MNITTRIATAALTLAAIGATLSGSTATAATPSGAAGVPEFWAARSFWEGGPSTWTGSLSADAIANSPSAASLIAGATPHSFRPTFGGSASRQPSTDVCASTPSIGDAYSWTRADFLRDGNELIAWCSGGSPVATTTMTAGFAPLPAAPVTTDQTATVASGGSVSINMGHVSWTPSQSWVPNAVGSAWGTGWWRAQLVITSQPTKGVLTDPNAAPGVQADYVTYRSAGQTGSDSFALKVCAGWPGGDLVCSPIRTATISIS